VWGALKEHFIERGIHGMHHGQPWWYYAKVLAPQLLPWTFLVPGALLLAWRRRDRTDRFLLVAVIFVVLFFSISTEKRTLYVLPAFPAFALLTGRFIGAIVGWDHGPRISHRWLTVGQSILAGLFCLLGAAAPFAASRVDEVPAPVLWVIAAVLLATGIATFAAVAGRRLLGAAVAPAVGMAVTYLLVATMIFPAANRFKSSREFAEIIVEASAASRAAGHRVVAFDVGNLPVAYALFGNGLYTLETQDADVLARHLEQPARVFAVVNAARLTELPPAVVSTIETIATTEASRREVALIANRPAGEEVKR
jgi:4-amino-4-deoxy-L-arabinose transferase-like glycosyltransferase